MRTSRMRWIAAAAGLALLAASPAFPQADDSLKKYQLFKAGEETLTRYVRLRSRIRGFESDARMTGGQVHLTRFSGELGGGRIDVAGNLDWTRKSGPQSARMQLQNVDSRQMLSAFNLDFDARIVTRVNALVDVQWQGLQMSTLRRTMNGQMEVRAGRGRVDKSTVFDALAGALGIEELRTVDFNSASASGVVKQGVLWFDDAQINGDYVRIRAAGNVDVPSDSIEIEVQASVAPELAQRSVRPEVRAAGALLAQAKSLREPDGFIRIPVAVLLTGTFTRPQATLLAAADGPARRAAGEAQGGAE
jgi:uncharacterized protein involved in outer membrane biogenesis